MSYCILFQCFISRKIKFCTADMENVALNTISKVNNLKMALFLWPKICLKVKKKCDRKIRHFHFIISGFVRNLKISNSKNIISFKFHKSTTNLGFSVLNYNLNYNGGFICNRHMCVGIHTHTHTHTPVK